MKELCCAADSVADIVDKVKVGFFLVEPAVLLAVFCILVWSEAVLSDKICGTVAAELVSAGTPSESLVLFAGLQ